MGPSTGNGQLQDIALSFLATCGFAQTTLEDIAQAADVDEADLRALYVDKG